MLSAQIQLSWSDGTSSQQKIILQKQVNGFSTQIKDILFNGQLLKSKLQTQQAVTEDSYNYSKVLAE